MKNDSEIDFNQSQRISFQYLYFIPYIKKITLSMSFPGLSSSSRFDNYSNNFEGRLSLEYTTWHGITKKRNCFVRLSNGIELWIYKKRLDVPFRRHIIVRDSALTLDPDTFAFKVKNVKGKWVKFFAESDDSMMRWLNALNPEEVERPAIRLERSRSGSLLNASKRKLSMWRQRRFSSKTLPTPEQIAAQEQQDAYAQEKEAQFLKKAKYFAIGIFILVAIAMVLPLYYFLSFGFIVGFAVAEQLTWSETVEQRRVIARQNSPTLNYMAAYCTVMLVFSLLSTIKDLIYTIFLCMCTTEPFDAVTPLVFVENYIFDSIQHSAYFSIIARYPIILLPLLTLGISMASILSHHLGSAKMLVIVCSIIGSFVFVGFSLLLVHHASVKFLMRNFMYQWFFKGVMPSICSLCIAIKLMTMVFRQSLPLSTMGLAKFALVWQLFFLVITCIHHTVHSCSCGLYGVALVPVHMGISAFHAWIRAVDEILPAMDEYTPRLAIYYEDFRTAVRLWETYLASSLFRGVSSFVFEEKYIVFRTIEVIIVMVMSLQYLLELLYSSTTADTWDTLSVVTTLLPMLLYGQFLLHSWKLFFAMYSDNILFRFHHVAIVPLHRTISNAFAKAYAVFQPLLSKMGTWLERMGTRALRCGELLFGKIRICIYLVTRALRWVLSPLAGLPPWILSVCRASNIGIVLGIYNILIMADYLRNFYLELSVMSLLGMGLGIYSIGLIALTLVVQNRSISLDPSRSLLRFAPCGVLTILRVVILPVVMFVFLAVIDVNTLILKLVQKAVGNVKHVFNSIWSEGHFSFFVSALLLCGLVLYDRLGLHVFDSTYKFLLVVWSYIPQPVEQYGSTSALLPVLGYFVWSVTTLTSLLRSIKIKFYSNLLLLVASCLFFSVYSFYSIVMRVFMFILWVIGYATHIYRHRIKYLERNEQLQVNRKIVQTNKEEGDIYAQTSCAICLDEYDEKVICTVLPCGHNFHSICISTWIAKSKNCPICREPVGNCKYRRIAMVCVVLLWFITNCIV